MDFVDGRGGADTNCPSGRYRASGTQGGFVGG